MFLIVQGLNTVFPLFRDQIVESFKIEGLNNKFSLILYCVINKPNIALC